MKFCFGFWCVCFITRHPLELLRFLFCFLNKNGGVWYDLGLIFNFFVFKFFFCNGVWIIPSPTVKLLSNERGKKDDEFLTNAFSLCTQMAIWFSYFDLLMWWIILIDFLILNHPRRNPLCSWCFIILIHPKSILQCFVSVFISEIVLQFYF